MLLNIGEIVSVRAFQAIDHFGIATGNGTIISNSMRDHGVVEQSLAAFSRGKPIKRYGVPHPLRAYHAVCRAKQRVGQEYRLLDDNCEHFIRSVYGAKPESPQIKGAIAGVSIALIGLAVLRS